MKHLFRIFPVLAATWVLGGCAVSDDIFTGTEEREARQLAENAVRFDTYMGGSLQTRSGFEGSITDQVLKDNLNTGAKGFGVFAYYTGAQTYNDRNGAYNSTTKTAPNFMYNEHIRWSGATPEAAGYWDYAYAGSTKYWPNEVQAGAVDDQDPAATTDNANGGHISFFAYAPYTGTESAATGLASHDKTRGITAFSTNATAGDPWVKYTIAPDGKVVDLLWGTYSGTAANVLGLGNAGVQSTDASAAPGLLTPKANRATYAEDILQGYTTNADLTKQKVDGRVGFAFKHALARVGGSAPAAGVPGGMMIILDVDKGGNPSGGDLVGTTFVTVESVAIKVNPVDYTADDGTAQHGYVTGGTFNLATGKWSELQTGTSGDALSQLATTKSAGTTGGVINPVLAEPDHDASGKAAFDITTTLVGKIPVPAALKVTVDGKNYTNTSTPAFTGVQSAKALNLYASEASPLVFIPGTKPSFNITITYYVRSFDGFLNADYASGGEGTWTRVRQTISKDVTFERTVELNKQYSILIHLGLTSVKFSATVSDWDIDDSSPNLTVDGVDLRVEDAHLPINVAEAAASVAYGSGSVALPDVAAGTTQVALTVTGLSDGTYDVASDAGNPAGDAVSPASVTLDGGGSEQEALVLLTLAPNTGTTEVSHSFTFGTRTVTVKQAAGPLTVSMTPAAVAYDAESCTPTYSVAAYGGETVTGAGFAKDPADTWVTAINATTGALTLQKNESIRDRTATITAKKDKASGTVTLTQTHAPVVLTVKQREADKKVLELTVTNQATGATVDLSEGAYTLTVTGTGAAKFIDQRNGTLKPSDPDATGSYSLTFTVTVGDAVSAPVTLDFTVPAAS